MTPKQKAKELLNRFPNNGFAKTCAYIAIEEILDILWHPQENKIEYKYWEEVKREIKKI